MSYRIQLLPGVSFGTKNPDREVVTDVKQTARYSVIAYAYSVLLEFRLLASLTRFFVSVNWCVKPCVEERDVILQILFLLVRQPLVGKGLCIVEVLLSHSDTPHTIGLLWTSDQPVAETSTSVFLKLCETAAR